MKVQVHRHQGRFLIKIYVKDANTLEIYLQTVPVFIFYKFSGSERHQTL